MIVLNLVGPRNIAGASLVLAFVSGCCAPTPQLAASLAQGRSNIPPRLAVSANHLSPGATYFVGVDTVSSPLYVQAFYADGLGNVFSKPFSFACPDINIAPLKIGLFLPDGLAVARTEVDRAACR